MLLSCDAQFITGSTFPTGIKPADVLSGDYNSDGKQDMVIVNFGNNSCSIFLGNGDGSFKPATSFGMLSGPKYAQNVDLNNDGNLDIIVVNTLSGGSVVVFIGTGTGSFSGGTSYPSQVAPKSVATGDFNADSLSDIALTNSGSNSISVFLNLGNGIFGVPIIIALTMSPGGISIADFNNDGKPDIVVTGPSPNTFTVLLGIGGGGFGTATNFATGTLPSQVKCADLNNDGKVDLVIACSTANEISVHLGNGAGSFGARTPFAAGTWPVNLLLEDYNADGKLDVAVINDVVYTMNVMLGNGLGSFGTPVSLNTGTTPFGMTLADFSGDGNKDLAVANWGSNNVILYLSTLPPQTFFSNLACPSFAICTCTSTQCTTTSSLIVPSAATLSIFSNIKLIVNGSLDSLPGSTTVVNITSGTVIGTASPIPFVQIIGNASLSGSLVLNLNSLLFRTASAAKRTTTSVRILTAASVSGVYTSVSAVSTDPCLSVTAVPSYTATTVSVTIQSAPNNVNTNGCAPDAVNTGTNMSTGVYIGIAFGVLLVGVGIALLIIFLIRREIIRRTEKMRIEVKASYLDDRNFASARGVPPPLPTQPSFSSDAASSLSSSLSSENSPQRKG